MVDKAVESSLGTTPKAMKEQKKFLIANIDDAIKEAPDDTEEVGKAMSEIKYLQNKITQAFHAAKGEKGEGHTDAAEKFDKEQSELEKQIKEVQKSIPSVTIDVPNDGKFTVYNNKETLKRFKEIVRKTFPTAPAKKTGIPKLPSGKPSGYPSPGKLEEGLAFTIDGKKAFTDGNILLFGESNAVPETPSERWGAYKKSIKESRDKVVEGSKRVLEQNRKESKSDVNKQVFVAKYVEDSEGYGVSDAPVEGESAYTVLYADDVAVPAVINTDFYYHIIKQYPDATFKIGKKISHERDNIVSVGIYDKGKQVGVVMPMRSDDVVKIANDYLNEGKQPTEKEIEPPKQERCLQLVSRLLLQKKNQNQPRRRKSLIKNF